MNDTEQTFSKSGTADTDTFSNSSLLWTQNKIYQQPPPKCAQGSEAISGYLANHRGKSEAICWAAKRVGAARAQPGMRATVGKGDGSSFLLC